MKLKLLDLFSGIGGFSLGFESTGYFETIGFVEKDKFCQKVLKKNFNNIPIESEVRNVKGNKYKADIITGGFPCQPFSVAGKRRGTEDDRYLWDETIRVIKECKPRWFIGENVEGIINISQGKVLQQIQKDLEAESFEVQCLVIPASGIGAWHQRKRVWIIAYSNSNGLYRQKNNETIKSSNQSKEWVSIGDDKDVSNSNSRRSIGKNEEIQTRGDTINNGSKDVPNSKRNEHQHSTTRSGRTNKLWGFYSEKEEQTTHDLWSKTTGCDAIHGEDVPNTNRSSKEQYSWWQTQSAFCGVPHGISYELDKGRANRIKSLGNSIVPLIARELGIAIMKAEQDG
jgi:DNA (cytosine-5)-methyltransferase 1